MANWVIARLLIVFTMFKGKCNFILAIIVFRVIMFCRNMFSAAVSKHIISNVVC